MHIAFTITLREIKYLDKYLMKHIYDLYAENC
jgi:hypothetical protein